MNDKNLVENVTMCLNEVGWDVTKEVINYTKKAAKWNKSKRKYRFRDEVLAFCNLLHYLEKTFDFSYSSPKSKKTQGDSLEQSVERIATLEKEKEGLQKILEDTLQSLKESESVREKNEARVHKLAGDRKKFYNENQKLSQQNREILLELETLKRKIRRKEANPPQKSPKEIEGQVTKYELDMGFAKIESRMDTEIPKFIKMLKNLEDQKLCRETIEKLEKSLSESQYSVREKETVIESLEGENKRITTLQTQKISEIEDLKKRLIEEVDYRKTTEKKASQLSKFKKDFKLFENQTTLRLKKFDAETRQLKIERDQLKTEKSNIEKKLKKLELEIEELREKDIESERDEDARFSPRNDTRTSPINPFIKTIITNEEEQEDDDEDNIPINTPISERPMPFNSKVKVTNRKNLSVNSITGKEGYKELLSRGASPTRNRSKERPTVPQEKKEVGRFPSYFIQRIDVEPPIPSTGLPYKESGHNLKFSIPIVGPGQGRVKVVINSQEYPSEEIKYDSDLNQYQFSVTFTQPGRYNIIVSCEGSTRTIDLRIHHALPSKKLSSISIFHANMPILTRRRIPGVYVRQERRFTQFNQEKRSPSREREEEEEEETEGEKVDNNNCESDDDDNDSSSKESKKKEKEEEEDDDDDDDFFPLFTDDDIGISVTVKDSRGNLVLTDQKIRLEVILNKNVVWTSELKYYRKYKCHKLTSKSVRFDRAGIYTFSIPISDNLTITKTINIYQFITIRITGDISNAKNFSFMLDQFLRRRSIRAQIREDHVSKISPLMLDRRTRRIRKRNSSTNKKPRKSREMEISSMSKSRKRRYSGNFLSGPELLSENRSHVPHIQIHLTSKSYAPLIDDKGLRNTLDDLVRQSITHSALYIQLVSLMYLSSYKSSFGNKKIHHQDETFNSGVFFGDQLLKRLDDFSIPINDGKVADQTDHFAKQMNELVRQIKYVAKNKDRFEYKKENNLLQSFSAGSPLREKKQFNQFTV